MGVFNETLIVWEIKRFSDKQNTRINYYTRIGITKYVDNTLLFYKKVINIILILSSYL